MPTEAHEPDVVLASTTETQAELDHATGPDWRKPFSTPAKTEEAKPAESTQSKEETQTAPVSETGKPGAKEGESGTEKSAEKDEPLPKGVQKRLDTLTARLRETERALEEQRRGAKPAEAAKPTDPEPNIKDYKTWEEWSAAHTRWMVRDEGRKLDTQNAQDEAQARNKEVYDGHISRVEAYRTEHPDIDSKVEAIGQFEFSSEAANMAFQIAIVEAEDGPALLEYLADHPDELAKFHEYSPVRVQMALGRLSAALSPSSADTKAAPTAKAVSKAPTPATPVRRSTAAPATRLDDPKMSTDEWIRLRNQQAREKNRRH